MEKSRLSMIYSVQRVRSYLLSKPFVFLADSMIMSYLVKRPNYAGGYVKWLAELQEFDFTFMT